MRNLKPIRHHKQILFEKISSKKISLETICNLSCKQK